MGFAHTGSINISMAVSLSDTLNEIGEITGTTKVLDRKAPPSERTLGYVMLAWVLTVALRWSLGYFMLAPTNDEIIMRRKQTLVGRFSDPNELVMHGNKMEPFV